MNLGDLWDWERRRLSCRIQTQTQNPALDEIRERLSKMTGEVPEIEPDIGHDPGNARPGKGTSRPIPKGHVQSRGQQRSMVGFSISLAAYQRDACPKEISKTRKNIYKKFFQIPRSPPTKIMLDLQKDRLRIPMLPLPRDTNKRSQHSVVHERGRPKAPLPHISRNLSSHETGPDTHEAKKEVNEEQSVNSKEHTFRPYSGDLFMTRGVYMGGIIYQSRLNNSGDEGHRCKLTEHGNLHDERNKEEFASRDLKLFQQEANAQIDETLQQQHHTPGATEAKLHCAKSLAAWSTHGENAARLVEEGAVSAILILAKDKDAGVRKACASAFRHMSRHMELCEELIKLGAVPAISDLGVAAEDIAVSRDCCLALVSITIMNGIEAKLVEDGVVIALLSLMNQHEELAEMCSRGLFNLTCVDQPYMYMERVIKAFVSLASTNNAGVKHLCSASLCNLSDIKSIRSRIVEEGVVQVIGMLARAAEARTRRICAIVLHSLASTKNCRADMVSKGAVQVLYALSSDVDTITLHYIASAIIRLALEEQNLPRLVHEGGVTALCNICLRCSRDTPTTQLCASAFSLLSQQAIGRQAIIQEGCVPGLVALLHESPDFSVLRHGLSALTNLLVDETNHKQVLGQGGIAAVIVLCSHSSSDIREACALALFNFSRGEAAQERGVSASAIPAIIALSRLPEATTRMRCAATLCKLASVEENVSLMVDEGVVPAFIDMLQTKDRDIVKHCCAALCRLAHEGSSAVTIAEGAVPHVIAGCSRGSDAATRQSCCAVLSAISAHESCRETLCALGALEALLELAQDRNADNTTRLRCAVALANLSYEQTVQGKMVSIGIVPVVADLSNSYCEQNQLYCARTLCNLSCHSGSEEAIVEHGGVAALLMICMVRTVSHLTKQVCAKALLNLLCAPAVREKWLLRLADEGLVQAVSVISRLSTQETMFICATIFCTLSAQGVVGRKVLVERLSTLKDAFNLMRSKHRPTQIACGKTACNLLAFVDSQKAAVHAGAVSVLSRLCTLRDCAAEVAAADAFFLIAENESSRIEMVDANVLPILIANVQSTNMAVRRSNLRVLAYVAWWAPVRIPLLKARVVPVIVSLIEQAYGSTDCGTDATNDFIFVDLKLYILTYISFVADEHKAQVVRDDIVPALEMLYRSLCLSGGNTTHLSHVRMFLAASLRAMATATSALDKYVKDGAVRLLCDIMCAEEGATNVCVYEHCAQAIYAIAREQCYSDALIGQGVLDAIPRLAHFPECYSIAAAILHLLALDHTHREKIITAVAARDMLLRLAEMPKDPHPGATILSCAQTFLWLSRCTTKFRDTLVAVGFVPLLIRLSRHSDEKIASISSEALKNLSSGGSGGIEEGTISTLISTTLSGDSTARDGAIHDHTLVELPLAGFDESAYSPSNDILPSYFIRDFESHMVDLAKMVGGVAGAGPPPPEPPEMDIQATIYLSSIESTESLVENGNMGTSMVFSKMAPESDFGEHG